MSATVACFLDGAPWYPEKRYELKDPHSQEVLYQVASVGVEGALRATRSAEEALKGWRDSGLLQRRKIFLAAAAALRSRADEVAAVETRETTANLAYARAGIGAVIECLEETAALATALKGELVYGAHGQEAFVERVPYGVVFAIAPWNAPLILGMRAVANAIMAGNTAILKTSEYSPNTQLLIGEVLAAGGLPKGVLNVIHVAPEDAPKVCSAVIGHPAVGKVNFTGSTFVGSKIAAVCAQHIKPVVLELGGKAPFIVLADANVKAAAQAALLGGFLHAGQICMSTDRVYLHEDIADEFTAEVQAGIANMTASGTLTEQGLRGLFTPASAARVSDLVQDALSKGAKRIAGNADASKGDIANLLQPQIIEGITPEMRLYREEIFGPVFTVVRFSDEAEVIRLANDVEYGLAAAVWTNDMAAARRVAKQLESGMVHINGITVHDTQNLPHGGFKKSGSGRFNGIEGLREFSQTKVITFNRI